MKRKKISGHQYNNFYIKTIVFTDCFIYLVSFCLFYLFILVSCSFFFWESFAPCDGGASKLVFSKNCKVPFVVRSWFISAESIYQRLIAWTFQLVGGSWKTLHKKFEKNCLYLGLRTIAQCRSLRYVQ